jgi:hypothetical protein
MNGTIRVISVSVLCVAAACGDQDGDACARIAGTVTFTSSTTCPLPERCVVSASCSAVCSDGSTTKLSVTGDRVAWVPESGRCRGSIADSTGSGTCSDDGDSCEWEASLDQSERTACEDGGKDDSDCLALGLPQKLSCDSRAEAASALELGCEREDPRDTDDFDVCCPRGTR